MGDTDITVKINNINNTQRKVYRILRKQMGLQRYEANLAMLGYLMGEEAAKLTIYNYLSLTDQILKTTTNTTEEEIQEIRHEWEHYKQLINNSMSKHDINIQEDPPKGH